jgi:hypothetical protein
MMFGHRNSSGRTTSIEKVTISVFSAYAETVTIFGLVVINNGGCDGALQQPAIVIYDYGMLYYYHIKRKHTTHTDIHLDGG